MEIWVKSEIAPDYLVSNEGRVARATGGRGARAHREVKQFLPPDGRPTVTLRINGETKTLRVCNLVLTAFHGPQPNPKDECCHYDGNSANNRWDNLRWDTRKNNHADKVRHGTRCHGEKHPHAKLTADDVERIKDLWAAGQHKQWEIAKIFGVLQGNVSRIVNGKRWA